MSHVAEVKVEIKDLECLKAACEALGLEWRVQSEYRWYGRHVGDYPLPEGMTKEELGKCSYAIAVKGSPLISQSPRTGPYEVGVVKRANGKISLMWDFYRGGFGLEASVGKDCSKVVQEYAAQVAIKAARRQGLRVVSRKTLPSGKVQIVCG